MQQKINSAISASRLFRESDFIAEQFSLRHFHRGDELFDKDNGVLSAGLIVSGRADVYSISPDGGETVLSTLFPGDCFGISNIFGQEMLTRIICPIGCDVAFIPKSVLREKLTSDNIFCERYMMLLNSKLTFLTSRIAVITAKSSRAKLAYYLLSQRDEQNIVKLTCSKEQIARSLDMSRAALFREFALLFKEGIIEYDKDIIKIVEIGKLSRFITSKKERGNI